MTTVDRLARDYRVAFLRYLPRRDEAPLSVGYELGRRAVSDGVSILELALIHHDALVEVLADTAPEEVRRVAAAASEFFLTVLGPFDMAQRAFLAEVQAHRSPQNATPPAGS